MGSRSISAILWTLVSVNVITLVVGGLITWLGYSIPIRLKQIGLLPELVIIAGFTSLVVACLGLGALNYSSHHALNVYGCLCSLAALLLLFGIPDTWYKSNHFGNGSLLIDVIYFTLLFILVVLLVFAFIFAHYLRSQEAALQRQQEQLDSDHYGSGCCDSPNCNCALQIDTQHQPQQRGHHSNSIIDKWIPFSVNNRHRDNNLNRFSLALRSNNNNNLNTANNHNNHLNNAACHLSGFRGAGGRGPLPSYMNSNPYNSSKLTDTELATCLTRRTGATTRTSQMPTSLTGTHPVQAIPNNNDNNNPNGDIFLAANQYPPLVHKGFYHLATEASNSISNSNNNNNNNSQNNNNLAAKARSWSRTNANETLNEMMVNLPFINEPYGFDESEAATITACTCSARTQRARYTSSSKDDSLVQYGRRQFPPLATNNLAAPPSFHRHNHHNPYQSATIGRCRCTNLNSINSSYLEANNDSMLRPMTGHQFKGNLMPMLNSNTTTTYAIRNHHNRPKISRSKGPSSVLAMTAAAAAAVLGGVGDTTPLAAADETNEGLHDLGIEDNSVLMDHNGCEFDNNEHQLDVSMLNATMSETFHQKACH